VSRKNLSRTVIEGGRRYYNHFERDHSHRIERATTRAWLTRVAIDPDDAEDTCPPDRPRVRKEFHDKLGPALRWLGSQVGRPWDHVYSELCTMFDRRNLAATHVIDSHMLGEVHRGGLRTHSRPDFVVDGHGILRRDDWWAKRAQVLAWTAGRRAANTYRGWWWFRRGGVGPCPGACRARHYRFGADYFHATRYVADAALTKSDRRRLARLPAELAAEVVMQWP
jgi:hypothetical protein